MARRRRKKRSPSSRERESRQKMVTTRRRRPKTRSESEMPAWKRKKGSWKARTILDDSPPGWRKEVTMKVSTDRPGWPRSAHCQFTTGKGGIFQAINVSKAGWGNILRMARFNAKQEGGTQYVRLRCGGRSFIMARCRMTRVGSQMRPLCVAVGIMKPDTAARRTLMGRRKKKRKR